MKVVIVGAGIAGLSCALALTKWMQQTPEIIIIEIRPKPSTIGGAIGLTPNAVRALSSLRVLEHIESQHLGAHIDKIELYNVYSAGKLGEISFTGPEGEGVGTPPFKGLRILRSALLDALVQTVRSLDNVKMDFGHTITAISEDTDAVKVEFSNSAPITSDLLIGADGIHSSVRSLHVEPTREPQYTGIAGVSGFSKLPAGMEVDWTHTGLCQSQRGSLVCSQYKTSKSEHFLGAVMETADVKSKEGWYALGKEQEKLKERITTAYLGNNIRLRGVAPLVAESHDWSLWPVYSLPPGGRWCTDRTILIGDAAHAMPPQGESAGIALEDSIVLGRAMSITDDRGLTGRLAAYERLRRPRVDAAHAQATFGWSTQKDTGWLMFQLKAWMTWVFLGWTVKLRAAIYMEDLATKDLDLG